jgi:hypothetical protein
VLSLLTEEEMPDGYPIVDGLRRVAQLILGPIDGCPDVVQTPCPENGNRATVRYRISWYDEELKRERAYVDAADAYAGNTTKFGNHPVAVATTRAEGRALRKALGLSRIIVAEEVSENESPTAISGTQISCIKMLCQKLSIDPDKFISAGEEKFTDIKKVPYDIAAKMIKTLNEYQRKEKNIPERVKL